MNRVTLIEGDCREVMRSLPERSVHAVVTSPPYYNLRDYNVAGQIGLEPRPDCLGWATGDRCGACFVCTMVDVFREVWRVLRDDGSAWLNLGDSYNAYNGNRGASRSISGNTEHALPRLAGGHGLTVKDLKPKDLMLIPHRVALALQSDGWTVRQDNVWAKGSVMPESVQDRTTRAHEYVFHLTKGPRYFYDVEAVREPHLSNGTGGFSNKATYNAERFKALSPLSSVNAKVNPAGRNKRSVWTINPRPCPEAHFATMAPDLAEVCIRAATSERGCCPACLAPCRRIVEPGPPAPEPAHRNPTKRLLPGQAGNADAGNMGFRASRLSGQEMSAWRAEHPHVTKGWQASCACDAGEPVPATVLDPFAGAGTTSMVAAKLGRDSIGAELNPDYIAIAERRITREVGPLVCRVDVRRKEQAS
jgi:DNA modification methylase